MFKEDLLHIRCPVCRSPLRLSHYRIRQGRISSGMLLCRTCGHKMPVKARIPLLLPPGAYARRLPPEKFLTKGETRISESAGRRLRFGHPSPLATYHFRRGLYQGSLRYFQLNVKPLEDDDPSSREAMSPLLSEIIREAPRRLLQINAGAGHLTACLAGLRPRGSLTAVTEPDFGLIKVLEGRIRRSMKPLSFLSVCAMDSQLPFPTSYFDMVITFEGLKESLDVNDVLKEIRRILKPKGLFAAVIPAYGGTVGKDETDPKSLIQYTRRHLLGMHHGEQDFCRRLSEIGFHLTENASFDTGDRRRYIAFELSV